MTYEDFFRTLSDGKSPWQWQSELATHERCDNRTIRIPTGFGKTQGCLGAWLWHRVRHNNDTWPRRLLWCLPMRVLVEQTGDEVRASLHRLELLWDNTGDHAGQVGVHVLMGGSQPGPWHQYPEHCAIIIGTQDMLLSRALNRGYAAPRARWPMDFGLVNQDALWIMDEVQLMDVGLATSAQLQAFRHDDETANKTGRPCRTWWMSATLHPGWLSQSPDTTTLTKVLAATTIPTAARAGPLWESVEKPFEQLSLQTTKTLAREISARHIANGCGATGPTLVVMNTVDRAVEVWEALSKDKALEGTDLRLVHSRFRPHERNTWKSDFLSQAACAAGTNRIIVSTQVIEAGVDLSAGLLFTELAPWSSLVQRFGRCARWGGTGHVVIVRLENLKSAAPYDERSCASAARALDLIAGESATATPQVSPLSLERFEESHDELLPELYPYEADQLLLRHELDELFDTTPDLSGSDIDISRFIRSGDERDLFVFWVDIEPKQQMPASDIEPARDALCAVPFLRARDWLLKPKPDAALPGIRAWVWDYQDGTWLQPKRADLYPGQTLLVSADSGGYDPKRGFWPDSGPVDPVPARASTTDNRADRSQDDESLSASNWKTIATHGRETGELAQRISRTLIPELGGLFDLAGRIHDSGKIHRAFRGSIQGDPPLNPRNDLAKAPRPAWLPGGQLYRMPNGSRRPGLRHELASTLALFGVLQRRAPDHPALLGPWLDLIDQAGMRPSTYPSSRDRAPPSTPLEQEILELDANQFDLLAYLVCAHHGKLRVAWHAGKADQSANDPVPRIRGIRDGERLPAVPLCDPSGAIHELPETVMDLSPSTAGISSNTGAAWTDRVIGLLQRHGPFKLAWLEALLRAADQRASQLQTQDPLLETGNPRQQADQPHDPTPRAVPGEEAPSPSEPSAPDGDPLAASEPTDAPRGTAATGPALPFLATTLGRVTEAQLAPHLARCVEAVEHSIADGFLQHRSLDEQLIRDLHAEICRELMPQIAGHWRRINPRLNGQDTAPYPQVPILMRDYCLDLRARFAALEGPSDTGIPELLAVAEGRLLSIHPFEDFNGRTSRLWLLELLRRLGLHGVDPAPEPGEATTAHIAALKAADQASWQPLTRIWLERFAKEKRP